MRIDGLDLDKRWLWRGVPRARLPTVAQRTALGGAPEPRGNKKTRLQKVSAQHWCLRRSLGRRTTGRRCPRRAWRAALACCGPARGRHVVRARSAHARRARALCGPAGPYQLLCTFVADTRH